MLSIFGGKITTYRRLSMQAMEKLQAFLPEKSRARADWSGSSAHPGGDFPVTWFDALVARLAADYAFLPQAQVRRLARAYGTRARMVLGKARAAADLGQDFGAGLTEAEVLYLMHQEWALEAADVVWRRSKLGLRLSAAQITALGDFMAGQLALS